MSFGSMGPLSGAGLSLPVEVLEMVLAQLPHAFLITTCTTVCKHWQDVIRNPAFLPWKKLYHCYKVAPTTPCSTLLLPPSNGDGDGDGGDGDGGDGDGGELTALQVVKRLCQRHDITAISTCLVSIIRAIGHLHKAPQGSTEGLLECHPLYTLAQETLGTLTQSTASPPLLPHPPLSIWHLAATIVMLSPDVWHICSLISLMLRPGSLFSPCEVVEALYSLALFFLHATYTDSINLPTRYHYQLFYALYLYENERSVAPLEQPPVRVERPRLVGAGSARGGQGSASGQLSMEQFVQRTSALQHTHEQLRIISHPLEPEHTVKIVAFAGTGKTTTLLQLCKRRPDQRFFLVVYNKSVQEHCARIFPRNTTVKTAHALAFAAIGRRYTAVGRFTNNLTAGTIASFLETKKDAGNRFTRAALVNNTLQRFLNSADAHVSLQHVPETSKDGNPLEDNYRLKILLTDAEAVWAEMTRCSPSQTLSMTQEGQLKLWQLSRPKIPACDVLMVDEGQDMNPPMLAVFLDQPCAKVIVGDPYQQIYSFRGAINALESVPSTHTFFLTQSFRFGPEISYIASCILESLALARRRTLVGGNKRDAIMTTPMHTKPSKSQGRLRKAYLGRSNLEVYVAALDVCQREENAHLRLAFAGGINNYGLDVVLDVYHLSIGKKHKIKKPFIAKSSSVKALLNYADKLDDKELFNKVMMYSYSLGETPRHIRILKERCSAKQDVADITFSTIHKAKGLEWDHVVLLDGSNFATILEGFGESLPRHTIPRDELNLLYVSVTRAKKLLTVNAPILQVLRLSRERLEVLVAGAEVGSSKCVQCEDEIDGGEMTLVTKVSDLLLSELRYLSGGHLCQRCSCDPHYSPFYQDPDSVVFRLMPRTEYSRMARAVLITGQPSQD
ncbi:F-box DNA helicase 1-like [Eriocheir sinensis]|uniref:F-box DNA helicase 1-like n=1 Tax=Eriocheir sinensis TaxID=95602 RepID=UPI0021C7CA32|nr:F-box DNA helicase 1-like [Eriocheir sinensis]